jgi:hypothetical protein
MGEVEKVCMCCGELLRVGMACGNQLCIYDTLQSAAAMDAVACICSALIEIVIVPLATPHPAYPNRVISKNSP